MKIRQKPLIHKGF
ncbi:hypothetical protein phiS10_001 [Streptococcus phage phiS10]|nr:hypothetical protein phiS10_001 [Streptococcus phage phiS10]